MPTNISFWAGPACEVRADKTHNLKAFILRGFLGKPRERFLRTFLCEELASRTASVAVPGRNPAGRGAACTPERSLEWPASATAGAWR